MLALSGNQGMKMKRFLSVLLVITLSVPATGWAWNGKERSERENMRIEQQFQQLEQEASLNSSESNQRPNKVKALIGQADSLLREGSTKEEMDKAKSMLLKALKMAEEKDNPRGIAAACFRIGIIYMWRTDLDNALEYNKRAVKEAKRAGVCSLIAGSTKNLGNVYKMRGEKDEAARWLAEAMKTSEGCADKVMTTWILRDLGQICLQQGQYDEALKLYQKGLESSREIQRPEIEGYILMEIGRVYAALGRYPDAVQYLEKALLTGEQAKKPRVQQESLSRLGTVYLACGKYQQAVDYFQKALDRALKYGEKRAETEALLSQGEVYAKWGRYSEALGCLEKALKTALETRIAGQEAHILTELGVICRSRGQYNNALQHFEKALSLFRRMDNPRGEANVLNNMGLVYQMWGQYENALANFERTLEIYQGIGAPIRSAVFNISNLYLDLGQIEKAESAIRLSENHVSLGRLSLVKTDYAAAKKHYEKVLQSAQENRNADNLFIACTGLGAAHEGMGNLSEAAEHYRKAVEYTEDLRSGVDPSERETFFDVRIAGFSRITPYEGLARVLTKMKRPTEALKESEYTRARIFAEAISKRGEKAGSDVPAEVLERDSHLTNELAALSKNLQKAYETRDNEASAILEPQVSQAKKNLTAYVNLLRDQYPLFAATKYPQPVELGQTALKDDEWILAYHVTDSGLIIYLTEGKKLKKAVIRPVVRTEIDRLVRAFRDPLEMSPEDDIVNKLKSFDLSAGRTLSKVVLEDVISEVPRNVHLLIIPDDSLGLLPFEMLPIGDGGHIVVKDGIPCISGTEFLADRNPISYCQSITALTLSRTYAKQKDTAGKLLVFADPIFQPTDARYDRSQENPTGGTEADLYRNIESGTEGAPGISRLALTSELAENLARLYKSKAECYTGLNASKANFLKQIGPLLTNYDKIVFATHGYFGKDLPGIKEPVLILTLVPPGLDGFLRMSEVMGLKMNADLVALTACQTGLGTKITGEGTMGMGRAFQYAGAKSVLMSLWSVSQAASVDLVQSIFTHVREGKSNLEALGLARQEIRKQGYDHPFFWASFILVGEAN
jgi:tetratricopeptide (TPR) repeat protein